MIPHEYIEELTRRTDIVDVVGNYVQLKRKGRLYGGLCPFHSEKTPSFYVYPDTQSFYCFGCGVGGDVIHFVRRINSIDYTEAVKMLVLPRLPELHGRGSPAGPGLLEAARSGRQDHRPVRTGLCTG